MTLRKAIYEILGKLTYANKKLESRIKKLSNIHYSDLIDYDGKGNLSKGYLQIVKVIKNLAVESECIEEFTQTTIMNNNITFNNDYITHIDSIINNTDDDYKDMVRCLLMVKHEILVKNNLVIQ